MNDSQTWSLIGLLAGQAMVVFAMLRVNNRSLERVLFAHDEKATARFAAVDAKFDGMDAKFDAMDAKFAAVDAKFDAMDAKFDGMDAKFDAMDAKFDAKLASVESHLTARIDGLAADVGHRLDNVERDLTLIKGHLLEQQRSA